MAALEPHRSALEPHGPPIAEMPLGLIALEGISVGVLTGLVGVGGGFLIVPALVLLGQVPMKQAVGTSLQVIAMKSAAGFYDVILWQNRAVVLPAAAAEVRAAAAAEARPAPGFETDTGEPDDGARAARPGAERARARNAIRRSEPCT